MRARPTTAERTTERRVIVARAATPTSLRPWNLRAVVSTAEIAQDPRPAEQSSVSRTPPGAAETRRARAFATAAGVTVVTELAGVADAGVTDAGTLTGAGAPHVLAGNVGPVSTGDTDAAGNTETEPVGKLAEVDVTWLGSRSATHTLAPSEDTALGSEKP
jgi:hypothetical protein